jgi:hypothetical protein
MNFPLWIAELGLLSDFEFLLRIFAGLPPRAFCGKVLNGYRDSQSRPL